MLPRILEPELMDTAAEAQEYDAMDHSTVNRLFASDLIAAAQSHPEVLAGDMLDLGTGTARIPIEICRQTPAGRIIAVDAAIEMLELGRYNLELAGVTQRVRLQHVDAKALPYPNAQFEIVFSNSIIHHIPNPASVLVEAVRVLKPGGLLFFRDLLRPDNDSEVERLVALYAAECSAPQRAMFAASLRAALTLQELRDAITRLGFAEESATATSDRQWTWVTWKE